MKTLNELGKAYEKIVGYNICEDAPSMTASEIIETMKEYDEAAGDNSFKNLNCY